MKKKELLESTKIYTADHQKLNFKKDISKFPNLADGLDTAKDCILTGKEYSIFRNSDYDPKYIISTFITAFDNDYTLRATPYLLEYKLTPFSSFLIFHIADMRVNNIATEFVNPDCVYSCYT